MLIALLTRWKCTIDLAAARGGGRAGGAAAVPVPEGRPHHPLGVWNLASGRVLAKLGMKPEGVLRQGVRKGDGFEDVALVALLREEWNHGPASR